MIEKKIVRKKKAIVAEKAAVVDKVVLQETHSQKQPASVMSILFVASLVLNILYFTMLVVWAKTPLFDYVAFNKSLPSICAVSYKYSKVEPAFYNDTFKALCENNLGDSQTVKARLRMVCSHNRHSMYYNDIFKDTCESSNYWAPENPPVLKD